MSRPKGSKNKKAVVEKKEVEKVKPSSLIRASFKSLGKWSYADGESIEDAINNLEFKNARGVGLLVLEKGGVRQDKILSSLMMMRLKSANGLARKYILGKISDLFNKDLFE